jgi:hypothetical protein
MADRTSTNYFAQAEMAQQLHYEALLELLATLPEGTIVSGPFTDVEIILPSAQ